MRLAAAVVVAAAAAVVIIAKEKDDDDNDDKPCVITKEVHVYASLRRVNSLPTTHIMKEQGAG